MGDSDSQLTLGRQPKAPAEAPTTATPETPAAPAAETTTTQTTPAAPETPATPPPTTPQEWAFQLEHFNKWAGAEFKDEDEVKSSLKNLSKLSDYEKIRQERDELKTKYEEIQTQFDPRSHFVNEDEFRRQQILKKFPESDPFVMNKVLSLDEKKSSDVDILIAGEMLKGIDEASAKKLVYKKFDLSEDATEWEDIAQAQLKSAAFDIRKQIAEMKDVKLPEKVDFESMRQSKLAEQQQKADKLRADATPFVEKILDGLKEVSLPIEVEEGKVDKALAFEVDAQFRKEFKDNLLNLFTSGTFPLDEAGIKAAYDYAAGTYMNLKLPQMVSKLKKELNAQFEDAKHAALHNDKPLSDTQAPTVQDVKKGTLAEALEQSAQARRGRVTL